MIWSKEAEEAVAKVPFFVRRRVKKRVEEEACQAKSRVVTMDHVQSCRRRFLNDMESEVKGHQLEQCFGSGGCPNRAYVAPELSENLEKILSAHHLRDFLKSRVQGPLKLHHEFRVCISDCPNACSRPQIADLGLVGASLPRVSSGECTQCGACVDACREGAVQIGERLELQPNGECRHRCHEASWVSQVPSYYAGDPDVVPGGDAPGAPRPKFRSQFPKKSSQYDKKLRISSTASVQSPILDLNTCVACGQCIRACPTGTLEAHEAGFRIMVGGKLGRHPQLARELPGVHSMDRALIIVDACLKHFKTHCTCGQRFGEILNRTGLDFLKDYGLKIS